MVRIEIWDENISNLGMVKIIAQKEDGGKREVKRGFVFVLLESLWYTGKEGISSSPRIASRPVQRRTVGWSRGTAVSCEEREHLAFWRGCFFVSPREDSHH